MMKLTQAAQIKIQDLPVSMRHFAVLPKGKLIFHPITAAAASYDGDIGSIWSLASDGNSIVREEDPFAALQSAVQQHVDEGQDIAVELRDSACDLAEMQDMLDSMAVKHADMQTQQEPLQPGQLGRGYIAQRFEQSNDPYMLVTSSEGKTFQVYRPTGPDVATVVRPIITKTSAGEPQRVNLDEWENSLGHYEIHTAIKAHRVIAGIGDLIPNPLYRKRPSPFKVGDKVVTVKYPQSGKIVAEPDDGYWMVHWDAGGESEVHENEIKKFAAVDKGKETFVKVCGVTPDTVLTVEVGGEDSTHQDGNGLEGLINTIKDNASGGHSFQVVVDPDDLSKEFDFDGDGAFRIGDVSSEQVDKDKDAKEVEAISDSLRERGTSVLPCGMISLRNGTNKILGKVEDWAPGGSITLVRYTKDGSVRGILSGGSGTESPGNKMYLFHDQTGAYKGEVTVIGVYPLTKEGLQQAEQAAGKGAIGCYVYK